MEKLPRIAIVNQDKCKPKKCNLECKRKCPINIQGKMCIEVTKESKSTIISEALCIGYIKITKNKVLRYKIDYKSIH